MTAALNPLDVNSLLHSLGSFALVGILVIIFAETGLLIGVVLPGDSLLVVAGAVAASKGSGTLAQIHIPLAGLLIGTPLCAIAGAQLGHLLGAKVGTRMLNRPDTRLFKRKYVERAEQYFQKFGPAKAVFFARFIPVVRTFLNPVAGMLEMPAKTFFVWNVIGGAIWTVGVTMIGYAAGSAIPIDKYVVPGTVVIVLLSLTPILLEVRKARREKRAGGGGAGRHAATKESKSGSSV